MRRRTTRMSQADLQDSAFLHAHKFQKIAIGELIAHDWRVSSVNFSGGKDNVVVIVMRMVNDSSIGCAVYPDGSFARSKSPTIKWDWDRARRQAEATIPDQYVKDILDRKVEA